jgi:hypothetical protein
MIPRKYAVDLGLFSVGKKGKYTRTLTIPKFWMRSVGLEAGERFRVVSDRRDNSLHFFRTHSPGQGKQQ